LNGRIDLAQAEAVAELIAAQTTEGLELAAEQLTGELSRAVLSIKAPLIDLLAQVEAALDFPEDVAEIIHHDRFARNIKHQVIDPLEALLVQYQEGHVYREGISTIIVGRPNVGKSSLMNRLLQKERAIVTAIPGTTRDFIEETVSIRGIPLRLIDTAGLHHTHDALEAMGIEYTRERLSRADIVIFMVDGSVPITSEDRRIFDLVKNRKAVLVINKSDLPAVEPVPAIAQQFAGIPFLAISALHNQGIEALKTAIYSLATGQQGPAELPRIVPNLRHKLALKRALMASKAAADGLTGRVEAELIAIDLRDALSALDEIVGLTTTEDILEHIFNTFCIGK